MRVAFISILTALMLGGGYFFMNTPATAAGGAMAVNIAEIGGQSVSGPYAPALPVMIKK